MDFLEDIEEFINKTVSDEFTRNIKALECTVYCDDVPDTEEFPTDEVTFEVDATDAFKLVVSYTGIELEYNDGQLESLVDEAMGSDVFGKLAGYTTREKVKETIKYAVSETYDAIYDALKEHLESPVLSTLEGLGTDLYILK